MDIKDFAGSISLPDINEGIPDKVTVKELREALEEYAQTDKDWKDFCKMKYLSAKEAAGDHIYRLAKALLHNNGFYTYRDAVVDSLGEDGPSPKPEDFE
ncbi:MAG: hypothetical protein IJ161_11280 [Bacteroidales bacterium]|nr:hypothetical protein [Bacteroidales bacterium]